MADDAAPGIPRGGRLAERLFLEITGAERAPRASDGDAVLEGNLIEVKQTSTNTLNQVRPLKYLPLVVYHVGRDAWWVVPAHELVRVVTARPRGQHNEIAYECACLNLGSFAEFQVDAANLRESTLLAVRASAEYPELREEMERVLDVARTTAAGIREQVRATLDQLRLGT